MASLKKRLCGMFEPGHVQKTTAEQAMLQTLHHAAHRHDAPQSHRDDRFLAASKMAYDGTVSKRRSNERGAKMDLKLIASFQVDHTTLMPGMYTSRIDGDVVTYDIRMKRPNKGDYFSTGAGHTIEHLFATYARSGELSDNVVYIGPMGCRTGFYMLVRDLDPAAAIGLVRDSMAFIAGFEGDIPGAAEAECGNYLDHDLEGARLLARDMEAVLEGWTVEDLSYR